MSKMNREVRRICKGDAMTGPGKYLVWTFPSVKNRLVERFPDAPLAEIFEIVRTQLSIRAEDGSRAPFPYAPGVRLLTVQEKTSQGRYRITPVYEISEPDRAVDVLDVGVVKLEETDGA